MSISNRGQRPTSLPRRFSLFAALSTVVLLAPLANAQPPSPSVKVINGPDSPVPITGTVQVAGAPGYVPYSTFSGVLPGSGCFQGDCANYSGGTQVASFDLPTVPEGKRLIVVSSSGGLTDGSTRNIQIELRNNDGFIVYDGLKWIFSGPYGLGTAFNSSVYSEQLYATFEPGEVPKVRVSATPNLGGYFTLVFHGYLVDVAE